MSAEYDYAKYVQQRKYVKNKNIRFPAVDHMLLLTRSKQGQNTAKTELKQRENRRKYHI